VHDVDSLHVEIDNLNDLLVGFCFIKSIDLRSESSTFIIIVVVQNLYSLYSANAVSSMFLKNASCHH
jgi:hypothetical protein